MAPSTGPLTLVRSLSRSTWLALLDGAPVVARAVTAPPADLRDAPLLVPVIGVADVGGTQWLVSEHVEGTSVQRLLGVVTLSAAQATYIAARTLAGLATLHAAGRAHGRLSAGNVLVDRDGTVQLSDWALATEATPAADLAAARGLIAGLVRNADRPAARHDGLLEHLERVGGAPIEDAAVAAGELEHALGDSAGVADELGSLVGASTRPPGGVVAATPLPARLPQNRRPLTRSPMQRRWVVAAGTVLALAAAGAAVLAVSHRRHQVAQSPPASRTSSPRPASHSSAAHAAHPAAATVVAPRSAGFVDGVEVTPVETCQPGASCSVKVTIKITPHHDVKHVEWAFVLVDPCTGARTHVPGGSMIAQPSWRHIYTTKTVPVPHGFVALVAMTTAPVRAASAPLNVPPGHAQC